MRGGMQPPRNMQIPTECRYRVICECRTEYRCRMICKCRTECRYRVVCECRTECRYQMVCKCRMVDRCRTECRCQMECKCRTVCSHLGNMRFRGGMEMFRDNQQSETQSTVLILSVAALIPGLIFVAKFKRRNIEHRRVYTLLKYLFLNQCEKSCQIRNYKTNYNTDRVGTKNDTKVHFQLCVSF